MSKTPAFVGDRLGRIQEAGLLRVPPTLEGGDGLHARVDGRDALLFCSNDYLALRCDPRLAEAAAEGARRWGTGAGSSRLIAGSLAIHRQVEEEVADWLGTEAALVCSSGYQANLALIQGFAGPGDRVCSDALNHASLIDGCRLSRADKVVIPHGEPDALGRVLQTPGDGETFVVGEGLYSMDGDRGRVAAWTETSARYGAHLLVDEAHALGVFGAGGRGVCFEQGVDGEVLARVGTFGKALGAHGAVIATDRASRELLVNSGRTYIFTTALAPPVAAAALAGLRIVRSQEGDQLRERLAANARRLRAELQGLGLEVLGDPDSPIVPVVVGDPDPTMALAARLSEGGVFVMAIRPPTVPAGTCRLRLTVSAGHRAEDIDRALELVSSAR